MWDTLIIAAIHSGPNILQYIFLETFNAAVSQFMATLEEDEDGTIIFRYRIDPTLDDVQLSTGLCEYVSSENITAC